MTTLYDLSSSLDEVLLYLLRLMVVRRHREIWKSAHSVTFKGCKFAVYLKALSSRFGGRVSLPILSLRVNQS